MEFKDLQKVWDQENQQPMYVFDEEAVNRMVIRKARVVKRLASINEWGLILIAFFTTFALLIIGKDGAYAILAAVVMLFSGAYVWWQRVQRLRKQQHLGQSILEEMEQAIANARYLVRFAQTFAYWFLLPTAVVALLRMNQRQASFAQWSWVIGCFVLSYLLVRWELRKKHQPRLRRLEELRNKLME